MDRKPFKSLADELEFTVEMLYSQPMQSEQISIQQNRLNEINAAYPQNESNSLYISKPDLAACKKLGNFNLSQFQRNFEDRLSPTTLFESDLTSRSSFKSSLDKRPLNFSIDESRSKRRYCWNRFLLWQFMIVIVFTILLLALSIVLPVMLIQKHETNSGSQSSGNSANSPESTAIVSSKLQLPLSRNQRYIVDAKGKRVKLQCVSWPSHGDAMIPEGLSLQSLDSLSSLFPKMGLNCVRFTYANQFTQQAHLLVKDTVNGAGYSATTVAAIQQKNADLWELSLLDLYARVFKSLDAVGVMVIMDNHISKPGWCCLSSDGGRWWGQTNMNSSDWVSGLTFVASNFGQTSNVIGFSLRNEPSQVNDPVALQKYMLEGAQAVSNASPNSLIIMSGMNSATDLRHEISSPITATLSTSLQSKFMYEAHQYSFFVNVTGSNFDKSCVANQATNLANFLNVMNNGYPIFLSEWGANTVENDASDAWLNCFFRDLLERDLDNAVWPFVSQYYKRLGVLDDREQWSLGNSDMSGIQSVDFVKRLNVLSIPRANSAIVHTRSAMCVDIESNSIVLATCSKDNASWNLQNNQLVHVPSGKCVLSNLQMGDCSSSANIAQSSDKLRIAVDNSCFSTVATNGSSITPITSSACASNDLNLWFSYAPPTSA